MKRLTLSLLTVAVVLAVAAPAHAAAGFGARVGLGIDPDQFVAGVQADAGPLFDFARFVPSVDLGFGDNVTTFTFNADAIIPVSFPNSAVDFYAGGGPALTYWDFDGIDGDLEVGVSLVAGLRLPMGYQHQYNIETRFGISDIPDIRILLGILFGSGE